MKKLSVLGVALATVVAGFGEEAFPLVVGGRAAVEIVVPANGASKRFLSDVSFFTNAVFRCTGARLPVVQKRTAGAKAVTFELLRRGVFEMDEHEIAFPDADTLLIRGTDLSCRWVLNRILERDFGCVFCFPGPHGTHYPRAVDVSTPARSFKGSASLKAERHLHAEDPGWERSLCGRATAAHGMFYGHALWKVLSPERLRGTPLYDKIVPVKNGVRRQIGKEHHTWQPCLASEEGIAEAIRYLNKYFDERPNEKVHSIAVNDIEGFCECEDCARINGGFEKKCKSYPRYVDRSVLYYTWANRVAEGVAAKHPDVALGLLAYCGITDPPPFKLHPLLVPFLCTEIHQMMDPETAERRRALFAAWNEKADHIANWGYDYGPCQYAVPRLYLSCQKRYFNMKTDGTCPNMDGYFGEGQGLTGEGPKRYLFYRQMFDSSCDADAELDRWYRAVGGDGAAPHLKAYYDEWERFWTGDAVRKTGWYEGLAGVYFIFYNHSYLYAFDMGILQRATEHLQKAEAAALKSGDPDQVARMRRIADFHRFYAARMRSMGAGHTPAGRPEKALRFFEDLPSISAAAREKTAWCDSILSTLGYPKQTAKLPFYRDALKSFDGVANKQVDGNLMQLLNCAIAFSGHSKAVDDAIRAASGDARVLPQIRERLSAIAMVNSLPNLLDGVQPEKSLKDFTWDVPNLAAGSKVYLTMEITNRRIGAQTYRVYFASWNPRRQCYRDADEVWLRLGPGESKTVSLFSKAGDAPGGRVAVNMQKTELGDVSELEVSALKLCEIKSGEGGK